MLIVTLMTKLMVMLMVLDDSDVDDLVDGDVDEVDGDVDE